ncbi:hypothetical protein D030_1909A, partial [Vibrio parahaemolyticus AQ3810]
MPAAENGVNGN